MSGHTRAILTHLERLVAFDTRNPPRRIGTDGIFDYLRAQLPGFHCTLTDHGDGAVSLLAVRGNPRLLFNVHVDTVPDSPAWSADPLRLRVQDDRAIGLGACDIKGAAAGLLTAAATTTAPMAILFSSDEEANDARCVRAFVEAAHQFERVIVAEPTACRAVAVHRGIESVDVRFAGTAGHSSQADARDASAVHRALRWGAAMLDRAQALDADRFGSLQGIRMNIGRIEGGIKGNMVAPSAELRFNARPLPSHAAGALHDAFRALLPADADYRPRFSGPSLPACHADAARSDERARTAVDWDTGLGLPIGDAVDFWTEASLFSQAGLPAIVYGPGHIAQAHAADEWVALEQLETYTHGILRIVQAGQA